MLMKAERKTMMMVKTPTKVLFSLDWTILLESVCRGTGKIWRTEEFQQLIFSFNWINWLHFLSHWFPVWTLFLQLCVKKRLCFFLYFVFKKKEPWLTVMKTFKQQLYFSLLKPFPFLVSHQQQKENWSTKGFTVSLQILFDKAHFIETCGRDCENLRTY